MVRRKSSQLSTHRFSLISLRQTSITKAGIVFVILAAVALKTEDLKIIDRIRGAQVNYRSHGVQSFHERGTEHFGFDRLVMCMGQQFSRLLLVIRRQLRRPEIKGQLVDCPGEM